MSTYCVRGGVNQGRRSGWGSNIRTQGGERRQGSLRDVLDMVWARFKSGPIWHLAVNGAFQMMQRPSHLTKEE